jgi:hypothetical protein
MMEESMIPGYMHPILQEMLVIMEEAAINDAKKAEEMLRPCMMLKPVLKKTTAIRENKDILIWVAEYGDLSAEGITPEEAFRNFDTAWLEEWKP